MLGTNRARLIELCADLISKDQADRFIYLAASQPLLEIVTQGILENSKNQGLFGELPVYLFQGFIRRILLTALDADIGKALPQRIPIDRDSFPLKRSLISQILKRLKHEDRLEAIGPLAARDGCVTSIATLIGEIQRAGKTPDELRQILEAGASDYVNEKGNSLGHNSGSQNRFDHEIDLIYSTYKTLLDKNRLTEDDANGLNALAILRGNCAGNRFRVPWLEQAELLIIDGFFDFTPAQGEMLRALIPQFRRTIVNLNKDERNAEIFRPFDETISQLRGIADFEVRYNTEALSSCGMLSTLRERLFNHSLAHAIEPARDNANPNIEAEITYFDCTDRETEIRTIAKEIKRLVLLDKYKLSEIALVVRERASYAEIIARVMRAESVPCNIEQRITATEIPATRAVLKLLAVLEDLTAEESSLTMRQLADHIKSGYFRLSRQEIDQLCAEFNARCSHLLHEGGVLDVDRQEWRKRKLGIGRWDPDALENVIAYVGGDLRLEDWLDRCGKLIKELPAAQATRELLNIDATDITSEDEETQLQDAEAIPDDDRQAEKKRRPQRDVHLSSIAWTALVVNRFATVLKSVPAEGQLHKLRASVTKVLDAFQYREQVNKPLRRSDHSELPYATNDLHAIDALQRAFATAIKSIELAAAAHDEVTTLGSFISEVRRSLGSQTVTLGNAQRGGLQVLEATDVRGLRFRAIFVAGLVEGGFPLAASRDWIYPHEERERLKRRGLTLEDISPESLLKEEHYFYQVVCRATERLYLTRPVLLEGEEETVASYYIEEVRRAVAPAEIKKAEVARPDYDGKRLLQASSPRELTVALVRQQQRHLGGAGKVDLQPYPQINYFISKAEDDRLITTSALQRIAIERERSGKSFGPYDGQITDADLLALINKRFGPDFVHSASGLNTFGNCPYRFFAQRVLKLEPRGEAALDLQALDAGKLLHDILRRFFEHHRSERLDARRHAELKSELLSIADEVFDLHEQVVPPLNKQIWRLDREIRKVILEQVLLFELQIEESSSSSAITPAHFELAFGGTTSTAKDPESREDPLRLTRIGSLGQETIQIRGQIDRVDKGRADRDKTLVAYDYKLSKGASREDIGAGRGLQIPIYLDALEQLFFPDWRIAGGGYYTLRGGTARRNTGMYRASYKKELGLQAKNSIFSEHEWQQFRETVRARIWEFVDRMGAGQFTVEPSEGAKTCRFCDYLAVCRYQKTRIDSKKSSATLRPSPAIAEIHVFPKSK